ncbi:hypothetical protein SAMN02745857_03401 [Andreprevotia lacus DSM 23236]|jgi:hypothetical protein|uniref:Uncharacterized protein n=1 Tax=Andreprevotia lacus DSM 23236 TaxID=1121001 RepID=A0A1W1XY35_9NEIS|nr:hypothetical protein [Andreprevotia lacus]SMC28774.1 hypothetical protein SAMN02745857_03401 [Andreprevotia lacus DSM 23236]
MLPKPVYEVLPFVYFALAVLVLLTMESSARYLSALSLLAAGIVVLYQRRRNRHKHAARQRHFHM